MLSKLKILSGINLTKYLRSCNVGCLRTLKHMEVCKTEAFLGAHFEKTDCHIFLHICPVSNKMCLNPQDKRHCKWPLQCPTLSRVSNLGCPQRNRRKQVNHHNLTEPCKHGRAVTREGTVPLPPSIACCSPALHQEGRSMSSFRPAQASRTC